MVKENTNAPAIISTTLTDEWRVIVICKSDFGFSSNCRIAVVPHLPVVKGGKLSSEP